MENKNLGFEESVARLEEIVKLLESGDAKLEQALALFEEGVSLTARCNKLLDGAEQKVMMFVKDAGGDIVKTPMPQQGEPV
ncbi:MAG TPA: exodeoxyribonuclease VII small subunit [Candidatus Acidoferrum sp.]|nr:exodeoxyribonuclease VII small subunit [Candidatus Acidoferrum sp.]